MIGEKLELTPGQRDVIKYHSKLQQQANVAFSQASGDLARASMNMWLAVKEMFPDIYKKYHLFLTPNNELVIDRERGQDERE
jgi:hypothetical protein